jgi:hypothetical protein
MFIDLFIIVLTISAGAGGGRQNFSNRPDKSDESEDDKIVKRLGIDRF